MLTRLLNLALAVSVTTEANAQSSADGHVEVQIAATESGKASSNSSDEFHLIALEQDLVCYVHPTCKLKNDAADSPCCGSCTCATDCYIYGTCCLSSYRSLKDARDSAANSR